MSRWLSLLCMTGAMISLAVSPAHALVIMGPIKPGKIVIGYNWPEKEALTRLLKTQTSIGGHYIDAPSWWDGHYAATYLYRGNNDQLQQMVEALELLNMPNTTVIVSEGERFDEPNKFYGTTEVLSYDWELTLSETKSRNAQMNTLIPGMNERQIQLLVHLGTRLDRTKLRIPERMLPKPTRMNWVPQQAVDFAPADALHALARAARDD